MSKRGNEAEDQAWRYLQKQGLTLLERNAASRRGEIDLILEDGEELVMVEVRARANGAAVTAAASITMQKRQRIIAATQHWLSRHPRRHDQPLRFDVIAIDGDELRWIRNAFDAL